MDNTVMTKFEHLIDRAEYFANKAEELCLIRKEEFEITVNLTVDELEELKGLANEARLMYLAVLLANTDSLLSGKEIPTEVKELQGMLKKLPDALDKTYEGYRILIEE